MERLARSRHPECLELQELLDKANQAMQNNDYEKARTLTETAILGCQDMITALSFKKEVQSRLPFTKQQMIIFLAVGSSILTVVTLMMISPKRRKKVFEKIRAKRSFKIGFKLPTFKQAKEEKKKTDVWKR